jgi:5-methylthioribose kinase
LSHNDEHFGNIFSFENDYKIIDPRNSGYNFASQAINITIGSTLIFMTEFDFQEKNLDFNRVYINYTLPENAKKVYQFMLSKYLEQEEFAKNSILPELLFTNFFRAFCNVVNPKNFNVVEKNRTAILGQSIEIYSAVKNQLKNRLK